jgi:hypothetical protein
LSTEPSKPEIVLTPGQILQALRQQADFRAEVLERLTLLENKLTGLTPDPKENMILLAEALREVDDKLKLLRSEFNEATK